MHQEIAENTLSPILKVRLRSFLFVLLKVADKARKVAQRGRKGRKERNWDVAAPRQTSAARE